MRLKFISGKMILAGLALALCAAGVRADTAQPYQADGSAAPYAIPTVRQNIVKIQPFRSGPVQVYRPKGARAYKGTSYSAARIVQPMHVRVVNPYPTSRIQSIARGEKERVVRQIPGARQVSKVSDAIKRAEAIQNRLVSPSSLPTSHQVYRVTP